MIAEASSSRPIAESKEQILQFVKDKVEFDISLENSFGIIMQQQFSSEEIRVLASAIGRSTIEVLILVTKMDKEAAHHLSLALAQNKSLRSCTLIKTSMDAVAACEVILSVSNRITRFKMTHSCLKNIPDSQRPMYTLLAQNQVLEQLELTDFELDAKCTKDFTDGLNQNTKLKVLDLSANLWTFDQAFFEAIRDHQSLSTLQLNRMKVQNSSQLSNALVTLLESGTKLRRLFLQKNRFGRKSPLKALLDHPNSLITFCYAKNHCGQQDCSILSQILATNTTLTDLNLASNNIGEQGMEQIIDGLFQNTTLKRLDLRQNRKLSTVIVLKLASFLRQTRTLKRLDIIELGIVLS